MKRQNKFALAIIAILLFHAPLSQAGDVKGCCQSTPEGGQHCGGTIKVLGKKTCTLGWFKAKCDKGYTNCKKSTWALKKPGFTIRQPTGPVSRFIGNLHQ